MKKFLRWSALVLALLAVAGAVLWARRDVFLKAATVRALERTTGMRVELGGFQSGPAAGAVALQGLRFYNFPEFGGGVLLDVPDLVLELDRELAAAGRLHFKQLRLTLAELNVIQDTAGRWNFEKVERELTERNADKPRRDRPRLEFGGIDELSLSIGRIRYTDLRRPERSREIRVGVTNETASAIRTEEQLQEWLGSFLFRVILDEVAQSREESARRKARAKEALKDALDW